MQKIFYLLAALLTTTLLISCQTNDFATTGFHRFQDGNILVIKHTDNTKKYDKIEFYAFTSDIGNNIPYDVLQELNFQIRKELKKLYTETNNNKKLKMSGEIVHIEPHLGYFYIIAKLILTDTATGKEIYIANISDKYERGREDSYPSKRIAAKLVEITKNIAGMKK